MKKIIVFLVAVIAAIGLTSCSQKEVKPVAVEYNGQTYTVYTDRNIISDGTNSYSYSYSYSYRNDEYNDSFDDNYVTIFITYPDGSTWKYTYDKLIGAGSYINGIYSDLTVPFRYVSGEILFKAIDEAEDSSEFILDFRIVICVVVMILLGFILVAPYTFWKIFQPKKKRHIEPTDKQITIMRVIVAGILATMISIIISLEQ